MAKADNAYDTSLHSEGVRSPALYLCRAFEKLVFEFPKVSSSYPYTAFLLFFFHFYFLEETLPFLTISRAIVWVASLLAELGTEPWSRHLHTWFSIAGLPWAADKRFLLTQLFTTEVKGMTHESGQRGRTSRISIMFIH